MSPVNLPPRTICDHNCFKAPGHTGPHQWHSGEWVIEENVTCVVCPECAFTFAADHVDVDDPIYHCPACAEIRLERVIEDMLRGWE